MGKQKTIKAIVKRFRVRKSGTVQKVASGQNHFNAQESGKTRRNKRNDRAITNKKQNKLIRTIHAHQ